MANKGVEMINKVNRQEKLLNETAEKLTLEKMTRYQLEQRVDKLTDKVEQREQTLHGMIGTQRLHTGTIKDLIRSVNALHKWLMWESVSLAVLAIILFFQLV